VAPSLAFIGATVAAGHATRASRARARSQWPGSRIRNAPEVPKASARRIAVSPVTERREDGFAPARLAVLPRERIAAWARGARGASAKAARWPPPSRTATAG